MRLRITLTLTVLLLILLPMSPASAASPPQRLCNRAAATIPYPQPWPITCKWGDGTAFTAWHNQYIVIYPERWWGINEAAHVIGHELGHMVEYYSMVTKGQAGEDRRTRYEVKRGLPSNTCWYESPVSCDGSPWAKRGSEIHAQHFTEWVRNGQVGYADFFSPSHIPR